MTAQEQWLKLYRLYREACAYHAEIGMFNLRAMMKQRYRREAALERALEASQREAKRLQQEVNELREIVSVISSTAEEEREAMNL